MGWGQNPNMTNKVANPAIERKAIGLISMGSDSSELRQYIARIIWK